MIDNFEIIGKLLTFESEDDYYFVQILIRSKDNPDLGSNNRLIKNYAIKSIKDLIKSKSEIITLCNTFRARAYIHLTKRSFKAVALLMMKGLVDRISSNQCSEIKRCFNSASGEYNSHNNKTWVVDVDNTDITEVDNIIQYIDSNCLPIGIKCQTIIKTLNGFHIITAPFNVDQFRMKYCGIDIHKNNPTNLYTPCL